MAGSKPKCTKEFIQKSFDYICENGLADKDNCYGTKIDDYCVVMGINKTSHYNWIDENGQYYNSTYSTAIKEAKEIFRTNMVNRLVASAMKRAVGYDVDLPYVKMKDKKGKPYIAEKTTKKMHIPPDATMLKFLLMNFAPDQFKERQTTDARLEQVVRVEPDQQFLQSIPKETLYKLADTLQDAMSNIEDAEAELITDGNHKDDQ